MIGYRRRPALSQIKPARRLEQVLARGLPLLEQSLLPQRLAPIETVAEWGISYPLMVVLTLTGQGHLYPHQRQRPANQSPQAWPGSCSATASPFLSGSSMKSVVLPLTWFVLLSCVVALASGLSLSLV